MRKQILSGFMMFALVAGSLAPAGEVRAEEFQVVDSDNAPVYNEAKDQFETKVELTGVNAGKFRFQKDGGNWLETTKNSAVFGVEPIGISLYRCAYTENNSSEEKEWRLINVSYIDNGKLTLNNVLLAKFVIRVFLWKTSLQKENLWLDVLLAKGDEKYLTYSKLGNFLRLKKCFLGEKNLSVKLMETKEGETKELAALPVTLSCNLPTPKIKYVRGKAKRYIEGVYRSFKLSYSYGKGFAKPGKIEVLVGKKKSQLKVVKSISKKSGAKINMKKGTYRYFKLRAKYGDITVESKPVKIKA